MGPSIAAGNFSNYGARHHASSTTRPVLKQLRLASGSLVRVPGSWRDFP